jgi:MGT family glycosyltransferase
MGALDMSATFEEPIARGTTATFAFVVPPFMGHINPTLSVGAELLRRGHRVAWIGWTELPVGLMPAGGQLLLADEAGSSDWSQLEDALFRARLETGFQSIKPLYEQVLIPLARAMIPGVSRRLEEIRPDIVIADQQAFAGSICAFQKRLPYATFVTAPAAIAEFPEFPRITEWEAEQVRMLQRECGIEADRQLSCSDRLTVIFSIPELVSEQGFPPHYAFVGPAIQNRPAAGSFPWERLHVAPRPRVLVSLGTFFASQFERAFFPNVAEALGGEPLTVVAVASDEITSWPINFIAQRRIPQIEVLAHVDAVVCHAGHNTVCEALAFGLPVVALPIAVDQFHVASRVVDAGCGVRLKFKRFTPQELRESVWRVLRETRFRDSASAAQVALARAGGASRAADLLEGLARRR